MTYSGLACSLSKFALKVLGDKGRLPRKGSDQVKKSCWSNPQTISGTKKVKVCRILKPRTISGTQH